MWPSAPWRSALATDPTTAFVSYSREDWEFVVRVAKDLKAKGAKVWMDKLDIRPGQRWEQEIESALNGCSRMLVILSPASVGSSNVLAEATFAIDEGKEVIPVLYLECKIPFRLRPFNTLTSAPATTKHCRSCSRLCAAIGRRPEPRLRHPHWPELPLRLSQSGSAKPQRTRSRRSWNGSASLLNASLSY